MSFTTVANSTVSISAALPGSQTSGAFAVLGWTAIGELTDVGSVLGRTYNTATHAPIGSAQQTEKKASYKLGSADFTCGWDDADAGQIMLAAAANSNAIYSFKVVKQSGAIRYFTAQVMTFVENSGTVDNVVQGKFTLLRQTDSITA
jgi:putative heme degradation protein